MIEIPCLWDGRKKIEICKIKKIKKKGDGGLNITITYLWDNDTATRQWILFPPNFLLASVFYNFLDIMSSLLFYIFTIFFYICFFLNDRKNSGRIEYPKSIPQIIHSVKKICFCWGDSWHTYINCVYFCVLIFYIYFLV
jgi:hypothetical protein